MAVYAFDGTWNEDEIDEAKESNVLKFCKALPPGMNVYYLEGVGTRKGFIGKILGGLTGAGGRVRIQEAMEHLNRYFEEGDQIIDIIGFSRGAALALHFANEIQKDKDSAPIRFVGLWDVVASFGIPGNDLNIGWTLTLPSNVQHCYHAMALDERRGNFPVTRIQAKPDDLPTTGRLQEVWFRGVHSDVGGGLSVGLSNITLCWMLQHAKAHGLPVVEERLKKYSALCDPQAPISKNFDPKVDPARTIQPGDAVHSSVQPRGRVGGKDHNNPPTGMTIVS